MSLGDILGAALSGLQAAQAGLRSTSANIANVDTPGYARERINLAPRVTAGKVTGVSMSEPTRIADRFLEENAWRQEAGLGRADAMATSLGRLQALLGAPGDSASLPARLDAVGQAAIALTASAANRQTLRAFTGRLDDALAAMKTVQQDVSVLRADTERQVSLAVGDINTLLQRIDGLNGAVARSASRGQSTGGATDLRMTAINDLSRLIDIRVREQDDGRLFIETAGGVSLLDNELRQLSYAAPGGVDQPLYPPVDVHLADPDGTLRGATGERLDDPSVGGRLGGLVAVRDGDLPRFADRLDLMFTGLARSLNAASNAASSVPPPVRLDGTNSGLSSADLLHFSGRSTIAVTDISGTLVASTTIDFTALGPGATVADLVTAINGGLSGAATASFSGGRLTLAATNTGTGIAVADDPASPARRGDQGLSQFFGLNDLVTAGGNTVSPRGFVAADPHGLASGTSLSLVLRDTQGRTLTTQTLSPTSGGSFADLLTDLNGGPMAAFGQFSLDSLGRLAFTPAAGSADLSLASVSDTTDRFGTGRGLSSLLGIAGTSPLASAAVRPDIMADPSRLPLALLDPAAGVGTTALGAGDRRGGTLLSSRLLDPIDLGRGGLFDVGAYASDFIGLAGSASHAANDRLDDATSRRDQAIARRDNFSGVNIDEEMSTLVQLQNSYSASARVMTTATQMYDTLLAMVR